MRLILDIENMIEIELSTDALFLIAYDEECLDPSNEDEARKLFDLYQNGLFLLDYETLGKTGKSLASFVPYTEDIMQPTHYIEWTKYILLEAKFHKDTVSYRFAKKVNSTEVYEYKEMFTVPMYVNNYDKKYFSLGEKDKTMVYLMNFTKY